MEDRRQVAAPLVRLGQSAEHELPEPPAHRTLTPARVAAAVLTALALGFLFRFPVVAMLLLPFAGLAVTVASRWRWGGTIAGTVFASAFLAQVTSVAVTPFTWWMRFVFFLALIGAYVAFIARQLRHL